MNSINGNFNHSMINTIGQVAVEPESQPSLSKSVILPSSKPVIQGTGFESPAMNKSLSIQGEHKPASDQSSNVGLKLDAPGHSSTQKIERPVVSGNAGGGIIADLEKEEQAPSMKNAAKDFRSLMGNINADRLKLSGYQMADAEDLFKDGSIAQMASIVNNGDENLLRDSLFGGMSVDEKNTLHSILNSKGFNNLLAASDIPLDDKLALAQFKDNFNSLVMESEVNVIKDNMIKLGQVSRTFVSENHSGFSVFCRAIANLFRSIFGGETKTLDQEDLIGKAKSFAADHGYALHMMTKHGGMDELGLKDLLLNELKKNSTESDAKLNEYAADMAREMTKELDNWEAGAGKDIIADISFDSFIPSVFDGNYNLTKFEENTHELFHLICAYQYDSGYHNELVVCTNHVASGLFLNGQKFQEVFDKLPTIQQSKLKAVWEDVRTAVNNRNKQMGKNDYSWENVRTAMDNLLGYVENKDIE